MAKVIALTMGDPSGISTEISIKAWKSKKSKKPFFIIHDPEYVEKVAEKMGINLNIKAISNIDDVTKHYNNYLPIMPIKVSKKTRLGKPNNENVESILKSINLGFELAKKKQVMAMVTNPICKDTIALNKKNFSGHTEYLQEKDKSKSCAMMMVNKYIKIIPLTTHLALKDVPKQITSKKITEVTNVIISSLKEDFNIKNPKVAISGLNPHSGDGGLLGKEEIKIIQPTIANLRSKKLNVQGPFPADSIFRKNNLSNYDAFLCMYHDQALIPAKLLSFEKTVNYTAGLTFTRTSPDHGTGFDISNKFIASCASLIEAINMAVKIARNKY
mgnify:CR=1 FL=1